MAEGGVRAAAGSHLTSATRLSDGVLKSPYKISVYGDPSLGAQVIQLCHRNWVVVLVQNWTLP